MFREMYLKLKFVLSPTDPGAFSPLLKFLLEKQQLEHNRTVSNLLAGNRVLLGRLEHIRALEVKQRVSPSRRPGVPEDWPTPEQLNPLQQHQG